MTESKTSSYKLRPYEQDRYPIIYLHRMIHSLHSAMSISAEEIIESPIWKNKKTLRDYIHSKEEIERRYNASRSVVFKKVIDELLLKKANPDSVSNLLASILLGFTCFHEVDANKAIRLDQMFIDTDTFRKVPEYIPVFGIKRFEMPIKDYFGGYRPAHILRNKDPLNCAVLATAIHTFLKLQNSEHIAELNKSECERQSSTSETVGSKKGMSKLQTFKVDWTSAPLLKDNYSSIYPDIERFCKENDYNVISAAYVGKKSAGYYTIFKGCPRNEVCNCGGWKYETPYHKECSYEPSRCKSVLKVFAGFEVSSSYAVPRMVIRVPVKLLEQVFKVAKQYLRQNHKEKMLKVLDFFSIILLQDLPFLFQKYPTHALSFMEPFNTQEFKDYSKRVLEYFGRNQDPMKNHTSLRRMKSLFDDLKELEDDIEHSFERINFHSSTIERIDRHQKRLKNILQIFQMESTQTREYIDLEMLPILCDTDKDLLIKGERNNDFFTFNGEFYFTNNYDAEPGFISDGEDFEWSSSDDDLII